jgi:MFS family permease
MFALPMTGTLTTLLVASTGIAVGNSLMTPSLNGLASKSVSAAWQGRMLGVMASVASLARIIGPVLGGWLLSRDAESSHYGRSPYWTSGAIMLVALGLAITLHSRTGAASSDAVAVERERERA